MDLKIDDFKAFVKKKPYLIKYVKNNESTWQEFYEIYSLYGEDEDVWSKYVDTSDNKDSSRDSSNSSSSNSSSKGLSDLVNLAKNIDVDKVQNGISSLQKAISLFGDLLSKKDTGTKSTYTPRPLYKSFED